MKALWLTWHHSRRSRSLATEFNVPILEYVHESSAFLRHFVSTIWTLLVLARYRPTVIFLQYSFLLLIFISLYKYLSPKSVKIICDCHTKALRRKLHGRLNKLFWSLKRMSFSQVDICIISNEGLIPDAKRLTDRYAILSDKIPLLKPSDEIHDEVLYGVFVCSYALDEPLEEMIRAARELEGEVKFMCTGKIPARFSYLRSQPYENIIFTDYLTEDKYVDLISSAQCIIALTTEEDCLQCAGYEALSIEVPLVVSDTSMLRSYFMDSAVYAKNHNKSIVEAIRFALNNKAALILRMAIVKKIRMADYENMLYKLKRDLEI